MAAFNGIFINGVEVECYPEEYAPEEMRLGEDKRNLNGGLVQSNIKTIKMKFTIQALSVNQYNTLIKMIAPDAVLTFRDGIPIAEPLATRVIYETLETSASYILYIPLYNVRVVSFAASFRGNEKRYNLIMEEV